MSRRAAPTVDEILDAIDYRSETLPHPVELLTIEQAARHASIPKTTIDSAVSGSEQFRSMVLAEAILALPVEPGPAVWEALRCGIRSGSTTESLSVVLSARARELSKHPSLALFLSGYDWLGDPRVAAAVHWVARDLLDRFLPFVETVLDTAITPLFDGDGELLLLHVLLVEAYRRMVEFGTSEEKPDWMLSLASARIIEAEIAQFQQDRVDDGVRPLIPRHERPPARTEGRLHDAVVAGASLLIGEQIPLSIGMTVEDIAAAGGISVATFYRRFGSVASFERALLSRVGREVLSAFPDDFFSDLLEGVRNGSVDDACDAIDTFNNAGALTTWKHIQTGRPGREVMPWLGSRVGREAFLTAAIDVVAVRGNFYEEFTKLAGHSLADGFTGRTAAEVLGTHSTVAESLIRGAVDRDRALAVLHSRLPLVNAQVFVKSSGP